MSTVGPTPKERTNVQMWRIQSLYLYFYTLFSRKKMFIIVCSTQTFLTKTKKEVVAKKAQFNK